MKALDAIDIQILKILQENADTPLSEIAEAVNLTTTPCWKRIKRFEDEGIIQSRVAVIDAPAVGLGFSAFMQVMSSRHDQSWTDNFIARVSNHAEVRGFWRISGDYDYLIQVQVKDMQAFDQYYKKLVSQISGLSKVTTTFVMESLKDSTALPLDLLQAN